MEKIQRYRHRAFYCPCSVFEKNKLRKLDKRKTTVFRCTFSQNSENIVTGPSRATFDPNFSRKRTEIRLFSQFGGITCKHIFRMEIHIGITRTMHLDFHKTFLSLEFYFRHTLCRAVLIYTNLPTFPSENLLQSACLCFYLFSLSFLTRK